MRIPLQIITLTIISAFTPLLLNAQAEVETSPFLSDIYRERSMVIDEDTVRYKPRWFIPDQYKIQYAGSIGFLSIGFGYELSNRYHPTIYYGYLSPSFGGSSNRVHTVSIKNLFQLSKKPLWGCLRPTAGISINWGHTNNTFDKLPEYYPEKYYFQNKIHLAPFVGGELLFTVKNPFFKAFGIYSEVSALDAYLLECIRTDYIKPHMILSVAIGVTLYLH